MSMESPGFANQASSYSAEITRRAIFSPYARTSANTPGIISGGLLSTSDMQLSAPASGMSVNVSTGEAIVGGSEGGTQGGYYARNASQTNLTISTSNPTNPRIDTVALTIADTGYTEPSGVSGNAATLQVVTGTPTAGATLSNLNGKAALPASSLLLGYVLVPANSTNVTGGNIANVATQVRTGIAPVEWAYVQITSPAAVTATVESGATTIMTAPSFTADGSPVIVEFFCPYVTCDTAAAGDVVHVSFWESTTEITRIASAFTVSTSQSTMPSLNGWYRFTPSAGAHTYHIGAHAVSLTGSPTIGAGAGGTAAYPPAYLRITKA